MNSFIFLQKMKKRLCLFLLVMFQLTVEAQTSYLWSNGATTQTIEANPSQTTTYYVTVTDNGTTYHDSVVVYVSQPPTISGAASVCEYASTQLSVNATPAMYNPWMSYEPYPSTITSVTSTGLVTGHAEGGYAQSTIYFRSAEGCEATHQMSVNMSDPAMFNQVGPYIIGSTIPELPTTSKYGITSGTWSPAINNTATTTYTFTPNAGQCALSTSMTIVVEPVSYTLSANDSSVCAGEEVILSVNAGTSSGSLKVGDYYGGGVIGYIFKPGDNGYIDGQTHGIVVSIYDLYNNGGNTWGCPYQSFSFFTDPLFITGYTQTNAIVAQCKEPGNLQQSVDNQSSGNGSWRKCFDV
jgi:hypothetical protein